MRIITTLLFVLFMHQFAVAEEIRVAAASDLQFLLVEIAARYEKQTGDQVIPIFGSSGNLFAQISNGAPFDVFFSADVQYPEKLYEKKLAAQPRPYARGQIVIWTLRNSGIDPARGFQCLLTASKIAIANPQHAPYGRAAVTALQRSRIYEQIQEKLVYGENVSQAAAFVQSGSAQAGIIPLSLAVNGSMKTKGRYWEIPLQTYPVLNQAAVVLASSRNRRLADSFLSFFLKTAAKEVLQQHGFLPPVW